MTHQEIFRKAWSVARLRKYKKLLWFGFVPAFLTTVVSSLVYSVRGYQYWVELFMGENILEVAGTFSGTFFTALSGQPLLLMALIVVIALFAACYMLLPIFLHGGMIKLTEQAILGEPIRIRMGLLYSSQHFLRLFEADAITYPFRLSLVFLIYWAVRTFAPELVVLILFPLGCWLIVSILMNVMLLFTDYYIVLKEEHIFPSFMASMQTVFLNIEEVLSMLMLLIMIALRILLNTAMAIGIPLFAMYVFSWFTSSLLAWLAWPVAIVIGFGSLTLLSYINAIFSVFLTAAWTLMFMKYTDTLPREAQIGDTPAQQDPEPQENPAQLQLLQE